MTLYPYQQQCVEFHLQHQYSLDFCSPGLGKTRIALETARQAGGKVAVFGPTFLERVWMDETAEIGGPRITYFPYSMLHKVPVEQLEGYSFWVAEEVHYCKSPGSRRTEAFYNLLKKLQPQYFLGLTGTPIRNRIPDLWTLLAFCNVNPQNTSGLKLGPPFDRYHGFARHFCNVKKMKIAGHTVTKYLDLKDGMLPELKALLKDKMIKFTVEEVLKDLPELTRKHVHMPLAPTPKLQETFDAYMAGAKIDPRAKADSAYLKSPATVEYCLGLILGGSGPLVIFTDHVESAKHISVNIPGAVMITGATPMHVRQEAVEQFQAGKHKALVATIGAMSVGVTLTAARHVVFNDSSWVPSDNVQAEKRIHRIGQKNACWSHLIESSPTDRYINKTLTEKMDAITGIV